MDNTIYFPMHTFAYNEKFTFVVVVGVFCFFVVVCFVLLWFGFFLAAPLMSGTSQQVRKSYLA